MNFFVVLTTVAILYGCTVESHSLKNADTELKNILYFGWFLNVTTTGSLERYTETVFRQVYDDVPFVQKFMLKVNPGRDPFRYFVKPLDPTTLMFDHYYHVTAMYCGEGADCTDYYEKAKRFIGVTFTTHLIGFYFTKRTFGVRVNLTAAQLPLFDMDEKSVHVESRSYVIDIGVTKRMYPGITFLNQTEPMNFKPSTSRAHITLGCAPEIPAVQAGLDLLNIVGYEAGPDDYEEFALDELGVLRIFEKQNTEKTAFVLYPYDELVVDATFQPYKTKTTTTSSSKISSSTPPRQFSLPLLTLIILCIQFQ